MRITGFYRWLSSGLAALSFACGALPAHADSMFVGAPVRVFDLTGKMDTIANATFEYIDKTTAPGRGGEVCCATLPIVWRTGGSKIIVSWVKDPNPDEYLGFSTPGYLDAYKKHAARYTRHRVTLDHLPKYERSCGVNLFFLPCDQVRVVVDCKQLSRIESGDTQANAIREWGVQTCQTS